MKLKLLENLKTIIIAIFIATIIRSILLQPFYIPSSSMENTLLVGDRLFVTKYSYGYSKHSFPFSPALFSNRIFFNKPSRGDVIVFKTPTDNRTDYIKRLVGLPGDRIQFIKGDLFLNEKKIKKRFIKKSIINCGKFKFEANLYEEKINELTKYQIAYSVQNSMQNTSSYIVPKKHYFFLGDNRDCSKDSRFLSSVGYVKEENLVGKARFLFFSNNADIGNLFTVWKWHKSIRFDRLIKKII